MHSNELSSLVSHKNKRITYLLLFIPISIFYILFFHFIKNIPYIDDFYWYFRFIDNFDNASTFIDKLTIFLEPYNSHRHYVQRILILLSVYLYGEVNIAFFAVIGNLFFLILVYDIAKYTTRNTVGLIFLVWLFFQPISFINYYTFAFFNLPVLLFAWLCLRLMLQQSGLARIILIGLLATFSNGNGILVWVLGMLISYTQTNYKRLFTYSFILGGLALLFILQGSHSEMNQTGHTYNVAFLVSTILYFIQLHASFINWSDYQIAWIAIVVGMALLLLFGSLLLKLKVNYRTNRQSVFLYYLLFLLLSMALISLGRASLEGVIAQVVDHYRIYACLFLGCLTCYYLSDNNVSKRLQIGMLVIAVFVTTANYGLYLPRMYAHFNRQLADGLNFNAAKKWLFYPPIQGEKEYAFVNRISNSVIDKKLYTPFLPTVIHKKIASIGQRDSTQSIVTFQLKDANYFPLVEEAFFVINCREKTYYFPATFERSWKDLLKLRLKQSMATTVVDWKTIREPCDESNHTAQFALLNGNNLTIAPLAFGTQNVKD